MKCNIDIKKEGTQTISYLPFDPRIEFSIPKGSIYVNCTINNNEFKSRLMLKENGRYCIFFSRKLLENIGLKGEKHSGIKLDIELYKDSKPVLKNPKILENETLKAIMERKSIRSFTNKKVSTIIIDTIINAGLCAPSATNKRPFHFIVTENKEKMMKIRETNNYVNMLESATVCIIVCGDQNLQRVPEYLMADCSAATQNMLLAIHSIGLGGVWCGVKKSSDFYNEIIKEFKLPGQIRPASLVAFGYTNEKKGQPNRYEINKVHYEAW